MYCPYSNSECKAAECAIFNPFLKGCGLMVNQLALGEEIAELRRNIAIISDQFGQLISIMGNSLNELNDTITAAGEASREDLQNINSSIEDLDLIGTIRDIEEQEQEAEIRG